MNRAPLIACALASLTLVGCAVIGEGGSGAWSPFFDDVGKRSTGIVDGWVFVPRQPNEAGQRPLTFAAYPLDPTLYVEASAAGVTLGSQAPSVADSRGFYSFDKVPPGEYQLRATDSTGAFTAAAGEVEVRKGAITTGLTAPVDPPEVRASEYFRVGRQDLIQYTSIRGSVEWRWSDTVTVGGSGAHRMSFTPPGSSVNDTFVDVSFTDAAVLLHGMEQGWLDPPTPIAPAVMSPGCRFDRSAALVAWGDGGEAEPVRVPVSLVSELVDVDDLILPAGRFDNCPKFHLSIAGEGISVVWEIWLAYRVGPVKIIKDSVDHQASYMQIGGQTYPK